LKCFFFSISAFSPPFPPFNLPTFQHLSISAFQHFSISEASLPLHSTHKGARYLMDPTSNRIEINPGVCNGRPVIRGTRLTVDTILSYLCAGDQVDDVLRAHPNLEREDVLAAIEYARRLSAARSTVLLA